MDIETSLALSLAFILGIIFVVALGAVIMAFVLKKAQPKPIIRINPPEPKEQPPERPTPWLCLKGGDQNPDLATPLRKNINGDVECMSLDGINCYKGILRLGCLQLIMRYENDPRLKPLACGQMYKKIYGKTGYDIPDSWCDKGNDEII